MKPTAKHNDEELREAIEWLQDDLNFKGQPVTREAIRTVLASLESARADSKRLDWIDDNCTYVGGGNGGTYSFTTPADVETGMIRAAIDRAATSAEGEA